MFRLISQLALLTILSVPTSLAATIRMPDGSTYAGEVSESLPNGYGTLYVDGLEVYSGDWSSGNKRPVMLMVSIP